MTLRTKTVLRLFVIGAIALITSSVTNAQTAKIALPSGWDDGIIDRIKAGESPKQVLAVLDFEGNEKLQGKVDLKLSDMLTTALVKSLRFNLVERNKIDRILTEQKFQMSDLVDNTKAVEVGKLLGAEVVAFGSITSVSQTKIDKFAYDVIKTEVGIDVRVVSAKTGRILMSETATGSIEDKLVTTANGTLVSGSLTNNSSYATASRAAVDAIAGKIKDLSVLLGFVVDFSAGTVMIDIGEENGVQRGHRFVVLRPGAEIIHPVTGKRLGWRKEILCEIEVVSTEKSLSSGKIVIRESAADPQPGDFVILQRMTK